MPGFRLRLRAPADPPLATSVRTFVASSGRYLRLDPESIEDLKLAANELFAAATAGDRSSFELQIEGGPAGVTLTVSSVPDLDDDLEDLPRTRQDLLLALFPDLRREGETLVIRAAADHS